MFASTELARRIEGAECDLLTGSTSALARTGGVETLVIPFAGGVATYSGPDSPLTKVGGLGFGPRPTDEELAHVEAEFARRGAAVQIELSSLAEAGLAERLSARGYALVGFENVLGLALGRAEPAPAGAGVTIETSDGAALEAWLDVVVDAFIAPDVQGVASHEAFQREALARVMRGMVSAPGFRRYLARRAGAPAGGASARLAEGIAQLCGAGTLPVHRRRGVQTALLEHCLSEAARAGCELAVLATLPGSKSQENVQRRGFEVLYARAILRRAP